MIQHHFIENKSSKKTMIFLHGWCASTANFDALIPFFKNDFSILLINYSDFIIHHTPTKNYFLSTIHAIKKCVEQYSEKEMIFVGHSMGGVMALSLAADFLNSRCIVLDSTLLQFSASEKKDFIAGLNGENGENAAAHFHQFTQSLFNTQYDSAVLIKKIESELLSCWKQSPHAFNALLFEAMLFEKASLVAQLQNRLLYIGATPSRTDPAILKKWNPLITVTQVNSGHYVMMTEAQSCADWIVSRLS